MATDPALGGQGDDRSPLRRADADRAPAAREVDQHLIDDLVEAGVVVPPARPKADPPARVPSAGGVSDLVVAQRG